MSLTWRGAPASSPRTASLDPVDGALGSTLGSIVALACMVGALVVLLRWWFQNRGR
ncbi:hypothetical protein Acsp06_13610 [Actinomycetospora sp. NBRC 106375]|nr:hypothetical protein Acsp06_13610 [Actinomycetospora sp. NBRC 106375]